MTEQEKLIARLWNEGRSAGQIAAYLGVTRNQISGVVHRMKKDGVKLRGANHHGADAMQKKAAEAREKAKTDEAPGPAKSLSFIDRQPLIRAVDQRDIPWDGCRRDACVWPTWKEGDTSRTMCGAPIDPHKPQRYCGTHYRAAYNPRAR